LFCPRICLNGGRSNCQREASDRTKNQALR
jgi:hypothetical protein